MKTLVSKIQLKIFEIGEFDDIKERSIKDTLAVIFNFPWAEERALASVELNCPSVTIEQSNGSYLKVGPYFGGKFCLYHYRKGYGVKFLIVDALPNISATIDDFYNGVLNLNMFRRYKFVLNPSQYFETNLFEYRPGAKAVLNYMKLDLAIYVAPCLVMCTKFFTDWSFFTNPYAVFGLMALILLFIGPAIYLLFDYEPYYQNQFLQISRGHQQFTFSDGDNNSVYNKADIIEIKRFHNTAPKNPWREKSVHKIVLSDDRELVFSSLLILHGAFERKFPGLTITSIHVFFPTMRNAIAKDN
jgi:hypothetical protein